MVLSVSLKIIALRMALNIFLCQHWTAATVETFHHDDVIAWNNFPRYWPFVQGIHQSPVNSSHKGQWRRALMFSLICASTNSWANNGDASDLRCYRAHYDVIVMGKAWKTLLSNSQYYSITDGLAMEVTMPSAATLSKPQHHKISHYSPLNYLCQLPNYLWFYLKLNSLIANCLSITIILKHLHLQSRNFVGLIWNIDIYIFVFHSIPQHWSGSIYPWGRQVSTYFTPPILWHLWWLGNTQGARSSGKTWYLAEKKWPLF